MKPFNPFDSISENLYIFEVSKTEVERKDIKRLIKTLKKLDEAGNACNKVWFSFGGYDYDTREIWEIPEIRQWAKIAFHKIPHLLYYAERDSQEGVTNLLSLYLDGEYLVRGEKVNAYEAVERGLHLQNNVQMILTLNNQSWMKMKQQIRKHAIMHDTLLEAEKTIKKVESIFTPS